MGAALTGSKQTSRGSLSQAQIQSISEPRRQSNSSLSAFQTLARGSEAELAPDPISAPNNRPYIIAAIVLLLAVVAVLVLMLLML